ncbi:helix-turn-helix domain-containing protein [Patescibacteria group bacterium]|nr:helix-turn-helix domain-containing protein [Patescibacteria group bacterium]MBU4481491.1 helix-turn-helix domain-containing protein [Patescibacteria group bacterium]
MPFRKSAKIIPYEMKKLGTYLKQLRDEAGLSIREAARKSELAPSYLFKIEKGDTFSTLSIHTILKLSKFYNIPIGALLKEVGLIDSDEYDLPDFPQYLRAKYHLSPQAIRDMEMAKEIVEKKYKK